MKSDSVSIWDQQATNPDEEADGKKDLGCHLGMVSPFQYSSAPFPENNKEKGPSWHLAKIGGL